MALSDDVTKFLADLDAFIASPSWLGAVQLTADGAAIIKDIAAGGIQSKLAGAKAMSLGTGLTALRGALAAELALPNINWQNVLAILIAILQALGPVILKG